MAKKPNPRTAIIIQMTQLKRELAGARKYAEKIENKLIAERDENFMRNPLLLNQIRLGDQIADKIQDLIRQLVALDRVPVPRR